MALHHQFNLRNQWELKLLLSTTQMLWKMVHRHSRLKECNWCEETFVMMIKSRRKRETSNNMITSWINMFVLTCINWLYSRTIRKWTCLGMVQTNPLDHLYRELVCSVGGLEENACFDTINLYFDFIAPLHQRDERGGCRTVSDFVWIGFQKQI